MDKAQYLLMKLAEEAAEVVQRCSKQAQFGPAEIQHGQELTNGQRLRGELIDMCAVWKLLQDIEEIPPVDRDMLTWAFAAKKVKMQKYLDKAFRLGTMPRITL